MDPRSVALELLGLLAAGGAWLCSLATTLMTRWLTLSTALLPSQSFQLGLWGTCVVQDPGGLECRPYHSLLGLPPDIKLARILMCVTLGAGLLAVLLAVPAMHLVKGCGGRRDGLSCKRSLKAAAGGLCLLAGVLGLVPVSYIAHLTVVRFFDESVPDLVPRWEFGDALFCGWTAGFLHLVAGTLLLTSCLRLRRRNCPAPGAPGPPPGRHLAPGPSPGRHLAPGPPPGRHLFRSEYV
ncbi:putative claudin-24 [Limanda limanda]|uniref:putative claudin-24 n=1 Tax=Limanda limanda TaxID=27771 RepID=UPI0029C89909|nr:putative claudin-24 [Limanda limanda]